jgi:hypothetical protein
VLARTPPVRRLSAPALRVSVGPLTLQAGPFGLPVPTDDSELFGTCTIDPAKGCP